MTPEILCTIAAIALLTRFVLAPLLRWTIPERFTVRYLLLVTTVVAVVVAAYVALVPHYFR